MEGNLNYFDRIFSTCPMIEHFWICGWMCLLEFPGFLLGVLRKNRRDFIIFFIVYDFVHLGNDKARNVASCFICPSRPLPVLPWQIFSLAMGFQDVPRMYYLANFIYMVLQHISIGRGPNGKSTCTTPCQKNVRRAFRRNVRQNYGAKARQICAPLTFPTELVV